MIKINGEIMLTTKETAGLLGIHYETVRARVRAGTLRPYRQPGGRRMYFKRSELVAFVKKADGPDGSFREGGGQR